MLRILHTADLHIGMKFNSYPEDIRENLIEARYTTLKNLIERANDEQCNIFAIAGDLFEKTSVSKKHIEQVISILEGFAGNCVLILPGNHDYDNGMVDLWQNFKSKLSERILLLNEMKVYSLKDSHDIDVSIYPAPCHNKHSTENNLGWIKDIQSRPESIWHIGIAHGALEGLSLDLGNNYYPMTQKELDSLPIDVWLLGHSHIPFPSQETVTASKILNAGTPEPDGMDCSHEGSAWIIDIDEDKNISAKRIRAGTFSFIDTEQLISELESFEKIRQKYTPDKAGNTLMRVKLKGRVDQEVFNQLQSLYDELSAELAYFNPEDSALGIKITGDIINKEFTHDSFPHQLLTELLTNGDDEALQVAYELIQEVKQ